MTSAIDNPCQLPSSCGTMGVDRAGHKLRRIKKEDSSNESMAGVSRNVRRRGHCLGGLRQVGKRQGLKGGRLTKKGGLAV